MITIYGMPTCPDCIVIEKQIEGNPNFNYIDIGAHVKNMKAFLKIRDNSPVFDDAKANGYAGIPCFVLEGGTVTITPEEAGLKSTLEDAAAQNTQAGQACRLDGSGC